MFIQLDPAIIQGREYDDGSTPMEVIKFEKLNIDEWAYAAKILELKRLFLCWLIKEAFVCGLLLLQNITQEIHLIKEEMEM